MPGKISRDQIIKLLETARDFILVDTLPRPAFDEQSAGLNPVLKTGRRTAAVGISAKSPVIDVVLLASCTDLKKSVHSGRCPPASPIVARQPVSPCTVSAVLSR